MARFGVLIVFICMALGTGSNPVSATDIGSRIKSFQMQDETGKNHSLSFNSGNIVVLVFWSYKCPSSNNYTHRMDALQEMYRERGITVFGVATGTNETAAGIQANKKSMQASFPVLIDSDGNLAAMLDATRTPTVFIIDGKGVLRYQGAFDNDLPPGNEKRQEYVEDALDALIEGRPVAITQTKADGCVIRK